jgi:beta-lactamase class A
MTQRATAAGIRPRARSAAGASPAPPAAAPLAAAPPAAAPLAAAPPAAAPPATAPLAAALLLALTLVSCAQQNDSFRAPWEGPQTPQTHAVEKAVDHSLRGIRADVAVAYLDLATGSRVLRRETQQLNSASTMKVPVLVAAWAAIDAGQLALDQPIPLRNEFRSIVDGTRYQLAAGDDADPGLYAFVGKTLPVSDLLRHMIVRSSNLAANVLVDLLTPSRVTEAMRQLGADDIHVLRGVADERAFQAGFNNEVTASDLMVVLAAIAQAAAAPDAPAEQPLDIASSSAPVATPIISHRGATAMLETLKAQEFNEKIPAGLPAGTPVAHKTGDMTGYHHDAAIVYPPKESAYVLVVLTAGFANEDDADRCIANLSRAVWQARHAPVTPPAASDKRGHRGSG